MNKRAFLQAGIGLAFAPVASAATTVLGPSPIGLAKRAWVEHPSLIRQNCPQWCWAASIAMIFASHGHTIKQEKIVAATFGGLVCAPSGNPITIARDLSREWTDDNGDKFESRVIAAYDAWNRINTLNNSVIVDQLTDDNPLLYCNTHHAMVNVAVDYVENQWGPPNVLAAGVLDPWPLSPGFHPLQPAELAPAHVGGQLTFLAAVEVND